MDRAPLGRYRRGETGTYRTMSCGVWRVIPHPEWTGFFGGHPPHLAYDSLIGSYAGAETRELSIILPSHSEPGLAVRRVSTSLRQVLTKFSEFFVFVSISGFPRKFRARKLQERRSPARLTHSIPVFASCTS